MRPLNSLLEERALLERELEGVDYDIEVTLLEMEELEEAMAVLEEGD